MNVGDLKKYKDGLYSSLCRDITEFEKNFLFISGGILAFSITFIKDIIKLNEADCLWLLFLSWGLIIFSIAVMMFSFLWSAQASDKLWNVVNNFLVTNKLFNESDILTTDQDCAIKAEIDSVFFPKKKSLRIQRWIAVALFIIGLVCFSYFVGSNIQKEQNKHLTQPLLPIPDSTKHKNYDLKIDDSTIIIKMK